MLAGRSIPIAAGEAVIGELGAWAAHRTRRVQTRTATKNQLLGQLDCILPGLTLTPLDILGTNVGRLVAAEFSDAKRLAALGASRFVRFAAVRLLQIRKPLAADLALVAELTIQIDAFETELARLPAELVCEPPHNPGVG